MNLFKIQDSELILTKENNSRHLQEGQQGRLKCFLLTRGLENRRGGKSFDLIKHLVHLTA